MLPIEMLPHLVEQRQERLRALAGPRFERSVVNALRYQVGTALIHLGTWIEGCRRDMIVGVRMPGSQTAT